MRASISIAALLATIAAANPVKRAPEAGYGITMCTDVDGGGHCREDFIVDQICQVISKDSPLYNAVSSIYTAAQPNVYPTGRYFKCDLAIDEFCHTTIKTFEPREGIINLQDYPVNDHGKTLQDTLLSFHCATFPDLPDPNSV